VSLVMLTVVLGIAAIVLLALHEPEDVSCNFAFEDKLTCLPPLEPPLPGAFACGMIEHLVRPSVAHRTQSIALHVRDTSEA
jgi:hypothetical protein